MCNLLIAFGSGNVMLVVWFICTNSLKVISTYNQKCYSSWTFKSQGVGKDWSETFQLPRMGLNPRRFATVASIFISLTLNSLNDTLKILNTKIRLYISVHCLYTNE